MNESIRDLRSVDAQLGIDDLHMVSSLGILCLLSILFVTYVYIWWHHPLYGKNKGPVVYPLVGNFIGVICNFEHIHDWFTEQLKKTNPKHMTNRYLRPGRPEFFITANPKNVEYILKTNFENYPKGPEMYNNLKDLFGNGIFTVDGERWKEQRRVAMHEFTKKSLRNFMHEIVQVELDDRLIPVLSKTCSAGVLVDLQDLFSRFSFDTICKLGFGVDTQCLNLPLPNVEIAHAFDTATAIILSRFIKFPFVWVAMRALNIGDERKLRESIRQIDEFAMRVIQKRKEKLLETATCGGGRLSGGLNSDDPPPPHRDLLSRFMGFAAEEEKARTLDSSERDDQKREGYSDVFLRDIVISFVLAGRDTSSVGLSWLFWLLSRNRHVVDAIRAEIREVAKSRNHHHHQHRHHHHPLDNEKTTDCGERQDDVNGDHCTNLPVPGASTFTYEELKNMHYLHAAVSESLRLYPPLPIDTKFAVKEDVLPDGTHIPKGSMVSYGPYAMGRMEQLWGADCLEFKPERWLQNGVFVPQCPYKYSVFQAGARICLGKELALLQIKMVTAALINCFDFYVPEDFKPIYEINLMMPMKNGLPTKICSREPGSGGKQEELGLKDLPHRSSV